MIQAWALHEDLFKGEAFNVVKFVLSVCSIFFDSIFLFQHYVLYPHARKEASTKHETDMGEQLALTEQKASDTSQPQNLNPSYTGESNNSVKFD